MLFLRSFGGLCRFCCKLLILVHSDVLVDELVDMQVDLLTDPPAHYTTIAHHYADNEQEERHSCKQNPCPNADGLIWRVDITPPWWCVETIADHFEDVDRLHCPSVNDTIYEYCWRIIKRICSSETAQIIQHFIICRFEALNNGRTNLLQVHA